ncbi:MAG TPA: DUF4157 domain-containing protein [Pyrinomonadaceae bacterium]
MSSYTQQRNDQQRSSNADHARNESGAGATELRQEGRGLAAQRMPGEAPAQNSKAQSLAQTEQLLNRSPRVAQLAQTAAMLSERRPALQPQPTMQRQESLEEEELAGVEPESASMQLQTLPLAEPPEEQEPPPEGFAPVQQKENKTGLPDNLKTGVEQLSGLSVDDVKAHYNSPEPAQLQALAYTQGTDIHVGPGQEQHLAHEAWHVAQQKQGRVKPTMQAKGVAINDDAGLEREADAMGAKALEMKQSAPAEAAAGQQRGASLQLERATTAGREAFGPGAVEAISLARDASARPTASGAIVQWKLRVNRIEQTDTDTLWNRISGDARITALDDAGQSKAKGYLKTWITASAESGNPFATTEDREYGNDDELIRALVGEVQSEENLVTETDLAQLTISSSYIDEQAGAFIARLSAWHTDRADAIKTKADKTKGRYNYYYSSWISLAWSGGNTLGQALASPPSDTQGRITLIADYALKMHTVIRNDPDIGGWNVNIPGNLSAARNTHWNPNEGAAWTQQARQNRAPLSAGPSATTAQILTLADKIGAPASEKRALAWAIFAFFNQGLARHQSGTHRFHEVMAIAANYGVPYNEWAYPESTPEA